MQRIPSNPIEQRKQAVRRYSRNGVIGTTVGVVGGVALAFLLHHILWLVIGVVIGGALGVYNFSRVRTIVNHRDDQ